MMMIFGMFVFSIPTATYQSLQRTTSWRHASNSCVGDAPAYQYLGPGEDTITLDGSIVPEFGNQLSLTALRLMGNTGKSYPLIAGTGKVYGMWKLDEISDTHTFHHPNGLARKVEFSIKLTKTKSAGSLLTGVMSTVAGRLF